MPFDAFPTLKPSLAGSKFRPKLVALVERMAIIDRSNDTENRIFERDSLQAEVCQEIASFSRHLLRCFPNVAIFKASF
jgi:hypothetical protein